MKSRLVGDDGDLPPWADERLSLDLINLRARGESQTLEYIVAFPQQAHDLAKEISAFATSNTGMIVLGVADDGNLVGLDGMEEVKQRDQLLKRLEGICNGSIRPAVTPTASWAVESGKTVLIVVVPKGSQPLYYSNGRPYLRHISSSRPAEPHEVIDLVHQYLAIQSRTEESSAPEETEFYRHLASVLVSILSWCEIESEERWVNPWLAEWMADSDYAARALRDLAATDTAVQLGIDPRMRELADLLQEVADFTLTLGSGGQLRALDARVQKLAVALKQSTIDTIPLDAASLAEAKRTITTTFRKLTELAARAEQSVMSGSVEQIQAECGEIGRQLMRLSFYSLDALLPGLSQRLRAIGASMRLLEVERMYLDGGDSLRKLVEGVKEYQRTLEGLVADISSASPP